MEKKQREKKKRERNRVARKMKQNQGSKQNRKGCCRQNISEDLELDKARIPKEFKVKEQ